MQLRLWVVFVILCVASVGNAKTIKICFEAENTTSIKPSLAKMLPGKSPFYSGNGFIDIPLSAPAKVGAATYKINVTVPGNYFLFARAFYSAGGGNSISILVNGVPLVLGEDGTYAKWHWISNPTPVRLKKGINNFTLTNRETGVRIDQFFLTNDSAYEPSIIRPVTHDGANGKLVSPLKSPQKTPTAH